MMGNRLSVLLLLLVAVLGSLVYLQTQSEISRQLPPAAAQVSPEQVAGPETTDQFTLPELAALTETIDRPLFSRDRRPVNTPDEPVQIVESPEPVSAAPISLSLTAVVINGAQRMALLQGQVAGAGLIRAEEGQTVEGWLVEKVLPERVVLSRGEEQQELMLRKFKPPPQALLPAPAARQPEVEADEGDESLTEALDLRRPRRPLRGPRLRSRKRNSRE